MGKSSWGDTTQFFFSLTPDAVLTAVETSGLRCNGRCMTLNSYENRVYEIELDIEVEGHAIAKRRVVKFYRPGRWSKEQILEEHGFLADLVAAEIPVIAPAKFDDGETLHFHEATGLWYTLFPKVGGRIPDEMDDEQLRWVGRLLARMHSVGGSKDAPNRLRLTPDTYGYSNLEFLLSNGWIPEDLKDRYQRAANSVLKKAEPLFSGAKTHRIHGDCHMSNLLWGTAGPFFLDFDDMVVGPPVQDFWLLIPGRDEDGKRKLSVLLEGYEEMQDFDRSTLSLIEYLRTLRYIHYTAWLARRWEDPAFPKAFPQFNTRQYWEEKTRDLEEQLQIVG